MTTPGDTAVEAGTPAPARKRRGAVIGAAVAVALVLIAFLSYRLGSTDSPVATPTPTPQRTAPEALSVAEIYSLLAASVVSIDAISPGPDELETTGTGVVVNVDGTILTALHVVNGAAFVQVTFADGTQSDATMIGSDPAIDIAALAVTTLPAVVVPAVLGASERLDIGADVVAIGNQLGLTSSTTAGVVSGLNRVATGPDGLRLTGLIQFDAAVNPGSSGGPLVNNRGETVGIVVALANPTAAGTFIGVGFAVPIGTAVAAGGEDRPPQQ